MAEIAGSASDVKWVGTFVWILAPGVLTGALFAGVLVHGLVTARGGPLAGLEEFFADGLGGGAIGVPLYGMAGGYALSGRGRDVERRSCHLA